MIKARLGLLMSSRVFVSLAITCRATVDWRHDDPIHKTHCSALIAIENKKGNFKYGFNSMYIRE
jgi:hypothetical protein